MRYSSHLTVSGQSFQNVARQSSPSQILFLVRREPLVGVQKQQQKYNCNNCDCSSPQNNFGVLQQRREVVSQLEKHRRRFLSYSRMLDMGGAPVGLVDRSSSRVDVSKNCRLQAICFDFELLTRSLPESVPDRDHRKKEEESSRTTLSEKPLSPGLSSAHAIARLLKVDLPWGDGGGIGRDDVSSSSGNRNRDSRDSTDSTDSSLSTSSSSSLPSSIASKYADRLARKGIQGGLEGMQASKQLAKDAMAKGDAAGHLVARKIAAAESVMDKGKKWMASTGIGSLLKFLAFRSMKIALLPDVALSLNSNTSNERLRMEDLQKQLDDLKFDIIEQDGTSDAKKVVLQCITNWNVRPDRVLLVSDKDIYIRAANDAGMVTLRIRPENARRGNVSSHYTVSTIIETQDVVNEINGISFNTVLHNR